jgi:hypothetical protein
MNPITIITAIPNIHTDSYKKQCSLGVGLTLEHREAVEFTCRFDIGGTEKRWSLSEAVELRRKFDIEGEAMLHWCRDETGGVVEFRFSGENGGEAVKLRLG